MSEYEKGVRDALEIIQNNLEEAMRNLEIAFEHNLPTQQAFGERKALAKAIAEIKSTLNIL